MECRSHVHEFSGVLDKGFISQEDARPDIVPNIRPDYIVDMIRIKSSIDVKKLDRDLLMTGSKSF